MPAAAPEKRVNGYLPQGSERSLWWQQTENRADRTGSRQESAGSAPTSSRLLRGYRVVSALLAHDCRDLVCCADSRHADRALPVDRDAIQIGLLTHRLHCLA
jgi:hypothetical protein